MENSSLPSEDGIWCLTHEEATRWVEEMIGLSPCNQVEAIQLGLKLLADSSIPLIWGPPCILANNNLNDAQCLIVVLEATKGTSYTVTKPARWNDVTYRQILCMEKVVNDRSEFYGKGLELYIYSF